MRRGKNCLLQAISPFLTMFNTTLYLLVPQNVALCGNGLNPAYPRSWLL